MSSSPKYNNSFFSTLKESTDLFYNKENKSRFHFLMLVVFISCLIDVMSFTSIIPVIYLINDPTPIANNKALHFLYTTFRFSSNTNFILFLLICLTFFFIIKSTILFFSNYLQNKFAFSVGFQLLQQQFKRFYQTNYLDIKKHNSQEYLRYIAIAPLEFATNILLPIIWMIYEVIVIILIVFALLIYYPLILLLVSVSIVPFSYFLIMATKKKLNMLSEAKGRLELESFKSAYEGISGYTDIKLFGKESGFTDLISGNFKMLYAVKSKENIYHWFPRRIIETLVILSVCILYAITSILLGFSIQHLVLILLAFATAAYRLMPSVNEILVYILKIKTSAYVLKHLSFFKENKNEVYSAPLEFSNLIEWSHMNFKYEENSEEVLCDVNLQIKKGEFVVIIGESGSGKTTLGKIMTGFIRQESGIYFIDGKEVTHFSQIKDLVGYVTQDFYLFDKSLLENIAIGETPETADLKRINYAIAAANLSEFVNTLPNGIHYKAGEMGARLSGGQRQRIAIARALYKNAQLLVLDEITSALDGENEMEILDTIYSISKIEKLTVLLITHRIAALNNYDKMYLMENGKLNLKA